MKKYLIFGCCALTACTSNYVCSKQYIANMYANGTLNNYDDTGSSCCEGNKNCPGCHVRHFDRVKLTVEEVLDNYSRQNGVKELEACVVEVKDSLGLKNVSASRYIPATEEYNCEMVFEKEKAYLKAMGFAE